jgi:fructose-bisphosphate aldolase, class II
MPIATPEIYRKMIAKAKQNKFAFAAINVTSMETARAAMAGFAEKKSDGIIQVSTGGAEYASGTVIKKMSIGAIALAEYVHKLADEFNVYFALHTDHCQPGKLDTFVRPLIEETKRRRASGQINLFNSHMFDGSELSLQENMKIAVQLLKEMEGTELLLEVEAGVVGGEEDGHDTSNVSKDKLYTTPEDMVYVYDQLSKHSDTFLFAATFGNVHGVYKPGNVKLKPSILKEGQAAVAKAHQGANLNLVFHGGSGSTIEEIHETLEYGVMKMNVDTDTQYAYTRPIADHFFKNYDGILKVDGEVGNKKIYDPRVYGKLAEKNMAKRIAESCDSLRSTNQTLCV